MKELKLKDIMSVEAAERKIWEIFDILRMESTDSKEYYVLLLLLSLYKDGIISKDSPSNQGYIGEFIYKRIHNSNEKLNQQYVPIYNIFESALKSISSKSLSAIIQAMSNVNQKVLEENFADIFDSVLYRISQSQGRHGGEFIQPLELSRFICGLADIPKESKVYNPFAGLASFGVFLDKGHEYLGQEINLQTWGVGTLRIMAYEKTETAEYSWKDSILYWPDQSEKFDLILANPPYGMRLSQQHRKLEPGIRTIEQFLLKRGVNSLNDGGKLIALLPPGFLFRGGQEGRIRENLIGEDLIDTIISLPSGLLLNTGIPLIVLVIDKNKKLPGKVRFVDATKFVEEDGPMRKTLDDFRLNWVIHHVFHDSDVVRFIDNSQIKGNNYNLNVPRYFKKEIEGTKLKEIIKVIRGSRENISGKGKVIRIRDLKDDKLDYKLDISRVEESKISSSLRSIGESCLLLATRGKNLKPTYFEFSGTPIYVNPGILSLKITNPLVDTAYLINELQSEYVEEQLASYRQGAAIPKIQRDDLLGIVIKLPSLEEQRAKIEGIAELSKKIEALQKEKITLAQGLESSVYRKNSSLKHALGKPLLNMGSSIRNIENALSNSNPEWESIQISKRRDVTLKDTFESLHRNMKLINEILKSGDSEIEFEKFPQKRLNFLKYIRNYVRMTETNVGKNITVTLDVHPNIKEELNNQLWITSNEKLLDIALNVVTENAGKHAFTEDSRNYKLEFRISIISKNGETYLNVEIANDGKPFPDNYTLEKFITNGSKAGDTGNTGQGGYQLNEIIKYHNHGVSTLDLLVEQKIEEFYFSTAFSFLIPLNTEI